MKSMLLFGGEGSIIQSWFVCQDGCTSIQGISTQLPRGVHQSKYVCLPSFVYWFSRHLCSINWGGPLAKEGSSDKYEHTSKLLLNNFWCNCLQEIHSHMGGPLAKEGSSDKYEHTSKLLLNIFQCNCLHQEIHSHFWGVGGPLANIGSSANFGVLVFKAFMLY